MYVILRRRGCTQINSIQVLQRPLIYIVYFHKYICFHFFQLTFVSVCFLFFCYFFVASFYCYLFSLASKNLFTLRCCGVVDADFSKIVRIHFDEFNKNKNHWNIYILNTDVCRLYRLLDLRNRNIKQDQLSVLVRVNLD